MALSQVLDDKLIAWNSSRFLQNTLMAWLIAERHELHFEVEELHLSLATFEENFAKISHYPGLNCTYYLLACMICNKEPEAKIIEFSKPQAKDIQFLLDSSVVPYVFYGLANADEVASFIKDRKKNLSDESAAIYLELLSLEGNPSVDLMESLTALYLRRKNDEFYSEARIYGGSVDNDNVCDVEFSAIASAKGFSSAVVPAVNKSIKPTPGGAAH
jgi:hypothetical protein